MDISTPINSSPSTPKPWDVDSDAPPPLYKSNSTVTSLSPEPIETSENLDSYSDKYQPNYTATPSPTSDLLPELDDQSRFSTPTPRNSISISIPRPRTYTAHTLSGAETMYNSQTLDYKSLSPPPRNPRLTILLVLTPNPASLADLTALETFTPRFCEDFSDKSERSREKWRCVNLYAHYREWAATEVSSGRVGSDTRDLSGSGTRQDRIDDDKDHEIDIGSIHPYALLEKLKQEKEVQWRLAVPVLRTLIDREVKNGARHLVVSGLQAGDVNGLRAFGRLVSILSCPSRFLPFLEASATDNSCSRTRLPNQQAYSLSYLLLRLILPTLRTTKTTTKARSFPEYSLCLRSIIAEPCWYVRVSKIVVSISLFAHP